MSLMPSFISKRRKPTFCGMISCISICIGYGQSRSYNCGSSALQSAGASIFHENVSSPEISFSSSQVISPSLEEPFQFSTAPKSLSPVPDLRSAEILRVHGYAGHFYFPERYRDIHLCKYQRNDRNLILTPAACGPFVYLRCQFVFAFFYAYSVSSNSEV